MGIFRYRQVSMQYDLFANGRHGIETGHGCLGFVAYTCNINQNMGGVLFDNIAF